MPYLKRINSLPLINHISYKYAQVSDIGPSWSSCFGIVSLFATELEEPKIGISGKGLNLLRLCFTMDLYCIACRARSAGTCVQSDLALLSPFHKQQW